MGFFDTGKRSFQDVPIPDDKISTTEFLEAAETVVALFGMFPDFPEANLTPLAIYTDTNGSPKQTSSDPRRSNPFSRT